MTFQRAVQHDDLSKPHPVYCIWEITLRCDLGCKHCGSRAGKARTQELSLAQCLDVVHQLAALGVREVVLIGGEAYLRDDWPRIAAEITRSGMACSMTTGARNLTQERIDQAKKAGLRGFSISIDGLEATHDAQRGARGSWKAACEAARRVQQSSMQLSANTQINRLSMPELPQVAALLVELGVKAWQIQLTVAMGRAADRPELLLQPYELLELFPMLVAIKEETLTPNGIGLFPANNIGYFGAYERRIRAGGEHGVHWTGCPAGLWALGIEADGTIKGCPSLPTNAYAGGNILDLSLEDIVTDTPQLRHLRERTREDLWGFCKDCYYAETCLGGCSWTSHSLLGRPGNNPYCIHRATELQKQGLRERITKTEDAQGLPFDHGRFSLLTEPFDAPANIQRPTRPFSHRTTLPTKSHLLRVVPRRPPTNPHRTPRLQSQMNRLLQFVLRLLLVLTVLFVVKLLWVQGVRIQGQTAIDKKDRDDLLQRRAYLVDRVYHKSVGLRAMPSSLPSLFQGEWALVTYSMTAAALTNLALRYPETRTESIAILQAMIRRVMTQEFQRFDRDKWKEAPLQTLSNKNGHLGYLGHLNWMLAALHALQPTHDTTALFHQTLDSGSPWIHPWRGSCHFFGCFLFFCCLSLCGCLFVQNQNKLQGPFVMPSQTKRNTPSFVLELPLQTNPHHEKQLQARFEAARQFYNACLQEALRRLRLLRESKAFRRARRLNKGKQRTQAFRQLNQDHGFLEYSLHSFATTLRRSWLGQHIDSNTAQKLASRAFSATQEYAFKKRGKPRFKGKRGLRSLEGKTNATGIRFIKGEFRWRKLCISLIYREDDKVVQHGLSQRVKYCRVLRKTIRGRQPLVRPTRLGRHSLHQGEKSTWLPYCGDGCRPIHHCHRR